MPPRSATREETVTAKPDIAALLAVGVALLIAIGDVIHRRDGGRESCMATVKAC
jgi:hypothetical protein